MATCQKQTGIHKMSYNILITGGTGSFGKAFVKKLLNDDPQVYDNIIIYSRDEHKQEKMAEEFKSNRLRFFVGDIRDKDRLQLAVQNCMYIVHAAALKIVPTGEYNPMEFVKTNILGAQNIIDVLVSDRTRSYTKVLALSTDKAVNPINLYGATKLCMEKLFLASNNIVGDRDIMFSIVRYGNVANSNGSVIHKFKEQVRARKPLTVTHRDMTRFWIELDEAAQFVYDCIGWMQAGRVYVPTMPSFRIMDLVQAFYQLSIEKDQDIPGCNVIGIRPGEKIHEQISDTEFSNLNEVFLSCDQLVRKLKQLGVDT